MLRTLFKIMSITIIGNLMWLFVEISMNKKELISLKVFVAQLLLWLTIMARIFIWT